MNILRLFLFFLIFFSLSSCSSLPNSNRIAPGYVEAFQSIQKALFGYESQTISSNLIDSIPYASLILKIGKGPEGILILESKRDNKEIWVSADEVYIAINNGRIVSTQGLINNLTNLILPYKLSDLIFMEENTVYKYYYTYDFPSLNNLEVDAILKHKGKVEVTILGQSKDLFLIEEFIRSDYLGWSVKNLFWIDEEGFVWKSEQNISPKLPPIYFEVTKKPSI